jgi:hypothetical protein
MSVREAKVLAISFSPPYDDARSASGRPCPFCHWLAGRVHKVLDTVVRGIGFLLMIVPILLLAIAEDRWAM